MWYRLSGIDWYRLSIGTVGPGHRHGQSKQCLLLKSITRIKKNEKYRLTMFSLQLIQCRLEFLCLGLWRGGDGYDGDGFVGGVFVVITVVNMTVMMMIKFCYCVSVVPDKKLWPNVLWGQYYWENNRGQDLWWLWWWWCWWWWWWCWSFTWYRRNAASLQDPPSTPEANTTSLQPANYPKLPQLAEYQYQCHIKYLYHIQYQYHIKYQYLSELLIGDTSENENQLPEY